MKYHLCRSPKSKPHIPNFQAKPHGFTLIEFMVASSLALVVLHMVLPVECVQTLKAV